MRKLITKVREYLAANKRFKEEMALVLQECNARLSAYAKRETVR